MVYMYVAPKRQQIARKSEILAQNVANSKQIRYFCSKMQQIARTW